MTYSTAFGRLGNMRANGVRTLAAWCVGGACDHAKLIHAPAD
jgi:hypothetical protein